MLQYKIRSRRPRKRYTAIRSRRSARVYAGGGYRPSGTVPFAEPRSSAGSGSGGSAGGSSERPDAPAWMYAAGNAAARDGAGYSIMWKPSDPRAVGGYVFDAWRPTRVVNLPSEGYL